MNRALPEHRGARFRFRAYERSVVGAPVCSSCAPTYVIGAFWASSKRSGGEQLRFEQWVLGGDTVLVSHGAQDRVPA